MDFDPPHVTDDPNMPPGKPFERRRGSHQITIRIPLHVWRKLKPLIEEGAKEGLSITDISVTLLEEALDARLKADNSEDR